MKKLTAICLLLFTGFVWADDDCTFDADEADSPGFANKLTKCETLREQEITASAPSVNTQDRKATKLYGSGTLDPVSGISERPVVAPGSLNHSAGEVFAARELYSLRPNAKFEESVTLAIHKLHSQMAQHCSKGWIKEGEWTEPAPQQTGKFFIHFRFRCSDIE